MTSAYHSYAASAHLVQYAEAHCARRVHVLMEEVYRELALRHSDTASIGAQLSGTAVPPMGNWARGYDERLCQGKVLLSNCALRAAAHVA